MTRALTVMMGVLMFLVAFMISLMRGTPSVTFMAATPAKWKVFSVICVPGSPMLCAPTAPTVAPGGIDEHQGWHPKKSCSVTVMLCLERVLKLLLSVNVGQRVEQEFQTADSKNLGEANHQIHRYSSNCRHRAGLAVRS